MPKQLFRERLFPSIGLNLALALSAPMVFLAALPISETLSIVLGIAVPVILIGLANFLAPSVEVNADELRAGSMRVPLNALGDIKIYQGEKAREQRGPELSPNSQRLFRGDIPNLVKVEVSDPEDPTDYLVISTRKPEELASALRANRP